MALFPSVEPSQWVASIGLLFILHFLDISAYTVARHKRLGLISTSNIARHVSFR
jgi:hypothetical protein